MNVLNKTTDYDSFTNSTQNIHGEDDDIKIILKCLLLSIPSGVLLICLINLIINTTLEPLLTNKLNDKFLHPLHPVRCFITGPSESAKPYLLTNFNSYKIKEFEKIYIFSPSLHRHLYQKLIKCFSNYIPTKIIPIILNKKDLDPTIDEINNDKNFEKSGTEIETVESTKELKYPQECDSNQPIVIILDDFNEKETNDPGVEAMFKRSRDNNISIFLIGPDYCELPKRTIRANGNIYHIFKPNKFRYVPNLYQDKASMDMTLDESKFLTFTCWNERYQPLTNDKSKDKYTGRYRLGLNSLFVPHTKPFHIS